MENKNKELNKVADDLIDDVSDGIKKFVTTAFSLMTEIFKSKAKNIIIEKTKGAKDEIKQ
jgi:hypothetical protein